MLAAIFSNATCGESVDSSLTDSPRSVKALMAAPLPVWASPRLIVSFWSELPNVSMLTPD